MSTAIRVAASLLLVFLTPVCMSAQQTIVSVTGRVTSQTSDRGVTGVSVIVGGLIVTVTDNDGHYAFRTPVPGSRFDIVFQRIGFRRRIEARNISDAGQALTVDVTLVPVPTVLEEITVDGRQITIENPGLVGFYERRELGYGRYLTQEEIDRSKGFDLTNVFRRLRFPLGCTGFTPLAVYLDGVRVYDAPNGEGGTTSALMHVNDLVAPSQLGGVELYADERSVRLPREFIPAGPYCGVAMFWTRRPAGPSPATLTAHVGSLVGRGADSRFAVGGGFGFPLRSESSLRFDASGQIPLSRTSDSWRAFMQITGCPLGVDSPWYVGVGAALIKPRGGATVSSLEVSPTLVTGVRLFDRQIRPFVELRILDPTSFDEASGMILTGMSIELGART